MYSIFNNFFDYLVNMNLDKQFPDKLKDSSIKKFLFFKHYYRKTKHNGRQ